MIIKPKFEIRNSKIVRVWALILLSGLACLAGLGVLHPVQAANRDEIPLQSKLVNSNGTLVSNGTYSLRFVLFNLSSGGTYGGAEDMWHEDQSVPVADGIFNVRLGSVTAFPADLFSANNDLYLQVCLDAAGGTSADTNCGTGTHNYEEVFTTRLPVNSVAYADYAENALALSSGGTTFSPDDFLRSNANDEFEAGNTLTITGDLDINTTDLSIADTNVIFDGASTNFDVTGNFIINSGDLFIEKATGNVGIENVLPGANLDVAGKDVDFNSSLDGETTAWSTETDTLPTILREHASVTANGYVYVTGGYNGTVAQSAVYYARLNSDGSTGAWVTSTNSMPTARNQHASVVLNGYLYVVGGQVAETDVYYTKLNSDGSMGPWHTNPNDLPGTRFQTAAVAANGYIYLIAGFDPSGGGAQNTILYAKQNSDGTTGTWTTNANNLPAVRYGHTSVVTNGYLYVIGGQSGSGATTTVYYGKINSNGSVGVFDTTLNSLPSGRFLGPAAVANGYVYVVGGYNAGAQSTIYYSRLYGEGANGPWSTSAYALPYILYSHSVVEANGYIYAVGGVTSGPTTTDAIHYTALPRVRVNGTIDLLGLSSTTLSDYSGGSGSTLYAGNIYSNGTLEVSGNAQFWSGVGVLGEVSLRDNLTVNGSFSISETGATPSFFSTFVGGDQAAGIAYTLPTAVASISGQVLTNNGSGVLSWTTPAGGITPNSLDYIDFEDTMDLDANLILNQTTFTWDQNYTGTTGTGYTYSAPNLTTGTAFDVNATNTALTNTAIQQVRFDLTNAQGTNANTNFTGVGINFTNNPTVAGNTEVAMRIQNQVTTNTTDNAVSALLLLDNADTSAAGSTVVTDAIRITNSGNIANGITTGLNIADSDIATDIALQNGETIDNDLAGIIRFSVDAAAELELSATNLYASTNLGQSLGKWEMDSTVDLTFNGVADNDDFGFTIARGDVNGDGFNDLIVGAQFASTDGRVYVYYGGLTVNNTVDVTIPAVVTGGPDRFGASVSSGDVNGDGFMDVIVGAPFALVSAATRGQAYVFYGGASMNTVPDVTLSGAISDDQMGRAVSAIGDVNGDGYTDVAFGAPSATPSGADKGIVYILFGGPSMDSIPDATLIGAVDMDALGGALSGGVDVNGDGFDDIIAGATGVDAGGSARGAMYIYFGGNPLDTTADITVNGTADFGALGISVSGVQDMNGDGYPEAVAGDINSNGHASIVFGGPAMDATIDVTLTGLGSTDRFGQGVGNGGDINGDGFGDVLVGAIWNNSGGSDSGQTYVFYGGLTVDTTADLTFTGASSDDNQGYTLLSADMNGDGFLEVITGAPNAPGGGTARGEVHVYQAVGNRFLSAFAQHLDVSNSVQVGETILEDWGLLTDTLFKVSSANWEVDGTGNASFQDLTVLRNRVRTLSPEYPSSSFSAYNGSATDTEITGTLTASIENAAGLRSYYQWTTTTVTPLQYYTVLVRVKLPQDFYAWPATGNALELDYKTSDASTANNSVEFGVYKSSSTTAVATQTAVANTSWSTAGLTKANLTGGAQVWNAAGDTAVIFIRLGALNSNTVRIGDIRLNYISKW